MWFVLASSAGGCDPVHIHLVSKPHGFELFFQQYLEFAVRGLGMGLWKSAFASLILSEVFDISRDRVQWFSQSTPFPPPFRRLFVAINT